MFSYPRNITPKKMKMSLVNMIIRNLINQRNEEKEEIPYYMVLYLQLIPK